MKKINGKKREHPITVSDLQMIDKVRGKDTSKQKKHSGAQWAKLIPSITLASWPVSDCQNMFNGERKKGIKYKIFSKA